VYDQQHEYIDFNGTDLITEDDVTFTDSGLDNYWRRFRHIAEYIPTT